MVRLNADRIGELSVAVSSRAKRKQVVSPFVVFINSSIHSVNNQHIVVAVDRYIAEYLIVRGIGHNTVITEIVSTV